jgi:hypothetical protein
LAEAVLQEWLASLKGRSSQILLARISALSSLGIICANLKRFDESEKKLTEALDEAQALSPEGVGIRLQVLSYLVDVEGAGKDWEKAESHSRQMVAEAEQQKNHHNIQPAGLVVRSELRPRVG